MITLAFIIGLIVILGVARYQKSVSLFFILLTAMLGGFAGGALVDHCINSGDADDTNSVQVQPMQNNPQGIGLFALLDVRDTLEPTGSAGQVETPASDTESIAPSEGIVLDIPTNPPQQVEIVDDS